MSYSLEALSCKCILFADIGSHMIDVLVNLAFNLRSKTVLKSTHDALKINKKGSKFEDYVLLGK